MNTTCTPSDAQKTDKDYDSDGELEDRLDADRTDAIANQIVEQVRGLGIASFWSVICGYNPGPSMKESRKTRPFIIQVNSAIEGYEKDMVRVKRAFPSCDVDMEYYADDMWSN
jgi:hypothetical protein